jgi:SAM-dependent methyltransferase
MSLPSVSRFHDRAADYVKYRPSYPPAAIDAILDGLDAPARLRAADVGAGTGISARLLADRGVHVVAVEPGEIMRGSAAPHANVLWTSGTAEATGLRASAFDLALCAQAFHWFRQQEALIELARILRPGGRLAIMWNRRSMTDPLTLGYRQAILDVGGEIAEERIAFDPAIVARSGAFSAPDRVAFPNMHRLDLDGLIGRARSASYVPKSGPEGERLLELLRTLHATYADADGVVTMIYETEIYRATKR